MDTNEFKDAWISYHKKLDANLYVNKEILRQLKLQQVGNELQRLLHFEIFSAVVFSLISLATIVWTVHILSYLRFSIVGILAALICLIYLYFSFLKIKKILEVKHFDMPIVKLQQGIALVDITIVTLRKWELLLTVPLVLCLLPTLFKMIYNIDIWKQWNIFLQQSIAIFVLGVPLMFWFNKHFYDRKLKHAKQALLEIHNFDQMDL